MWLPRLNGGVSVDHLAAHLSCSRHRSRTSNIGRARLANHSLRDLRTRLRHYLLSFPGAIGNYLAGTGAILTSLEEISDIPYEAQDVVHRCVGVLAAIRPRSLDSGIAELIQSRTGLDNPHA